MIIRCCDFGDPLEAALNFHDGSKRGGKMHQNSSIIEGKQEDEDE